MGDSDDEYDRRRARDKFRRERSDYQERRGEERGRREDYVDSRRDMWSRDRGRRDYREVDLRRRERYTPPRHDLSPPMKKMRRDWDDRGYSGYEGSSGGGYGPTALMSSGHQAWGNVGAETGAVAHVPHVYGGGGGGGGGGGHRQPTTMMTFKQFLASQDDGIGDEEAVKKYNDYKLDFRRQQLNDFFLAHKEEEWFKSKFQPEECAKRRQEQLTSLAKRKEVFLDLMEKNWTENISLDCDKSDELIRLLDAVVIKLEGGADSDLKVLDSNYVEEDRFERSAPVSTTPTPKEDAKKKDEEESTGYKEIAVKDEPVSGDEAQKKTKRSKGSDGEKEEGSEDGEEPEEEDQAETKARKSSFDNEESGSESAKGEDARRPDSAASSNDVDVKTEEWDSETKVKKEVVKDEIEDVKSEEGSAMGAEISTEPKEEKVVSTAPKALHRTCSIFLRNLAPSITKQEVEVMCKRFAGFLRVAIAEPQPERCFFRRGWATFERDVNIKEICWSLNSIRLRECELGAIVNRDLTRRIRSCSGITAHKQVVRADIKLAAKLVQTLDKRHELWTMAEEGKKKAGENGQEELGFNLISPNPLLKNITDYLIEEADAEEEELLGKSASEEAKRAEGSDLLNERDDALIKVLDNLILYLRIVHSIDYYNHSDYPNEDEMPNRCGIMHARGCPPLSKITQGEITDYNNMFETKLAPFLQAMTKLDEEEAQKLGKKDAHAEVEKFVAANTQELGKDKWLCPLSGKKFKGPEFVRKHIFNKHVEKVDEVRREVEYFNNYLMDPKRPHVPEFPLIRNQRGDGGAAGAMGSRGEGFAHRTSGYQQTPSYGGYGYGQGARMTAPYSGYGNRGGYGNNDNYRNNSGGSGYYNQKRGAARNRVDPREIVGYHDLDAPEDLDLF